MVNCLDWNTNSVTDWIYQNQQFTQAPEQYLGYVYLITNTAYNRFYIGKKLFWCTRKLPALKGQKRKRTKIIETDWRDYWGSSEPLLKDIQHLGPELFRREILMLCETKSLMSYHEARLQFERAVLLRDDYYNGIINCRINANSLKRYRDSL